MDFVALVQQCAPWGSTPITKLSQQMLAGEWNEYGIDQLASSIGKRS
jgi:hypothetical protein